MENTKCLVLVLFIIWKREEGKALWDTSRTKCQFLQSVMCSLHLFHQLGDDVQPILRNDPQQSHQVFMLQLPEKGKNTKYHVIGGF